MMNSVFLQGRLVADPEMRHTPNGVATTSFRIAVDRDFKDKTTGEKQVDFINIVTWRQTAEFASKFFSKGRMAIIDNGRLQIRDYTDKEGNKRTIAEVVADQVRFGDSKPDGQQPTSYSAPASTVYAAAPDVDSFAELADDGELPF